MKDSVKKLLIFVGVIVAFVIVCLLLNLRGVKDFHEKYEGHNLTVDVTGAVRTGTYSGYLRDHEGASKPQTDVEVNLFDYVSEGNVEVNNFIPGASQALLTQIGSTNTWK